MFLRQGKNDINHQKCFGTSIRTELQRVGTARIERERFSRSFLRQKVVNGFAGTITELDSREGVSKGALFEAGGGEGIVGGAGKVMTVNGQGQAADSNLIYGGAGVHAGVASASAGLVGFTSGVGLYGEGFLFGRGGGMGAYLNITNNAACNQRRR